MSKPVEQHVSLFELYKNYFRAKYRDPSKSGGCYHFPKAEISSSPYALTFPEWKLIVQTYFKHVLNYLKTGNMYILPWGLGAWQLIRTKKLRKMLDVEKGKKMIESGEFKPGTFVFKKVSFFNGYYPKLKWHKGKGVFFKNMSYVRATLIKQYWNEYWEELRSPEKRHWLYNLNEDK